MLKRGEIGMEEEDVVKKMFACITIIIASCAVVITVGILCDVLEAEVLKPIFAGTVVIMGVFAVCLFAFCVGLAFKELIGW